MPQNVFAIVGKVDVRISGGFVFWPLALDSPNGVHQGLWILAVIAVKPKPRYPKACFFRESVFNGFFFRQGLPI